MKEITDLNEAFIRTELKALIPDNEEKWFVQLVEQSEFENDRVDIEGYANIRIYRGEYELLEIVNNYAVTIGFIGKTIGAADMVTISHVLYVYSD